jgi:hypothetical protein
MRKHRQGLGIFNRLARLEIAAWRFHARSTGNFAGYQADLFFHTDSTGYSEPAESKRDFPGVPETTPRVPERLRRVADPRGRDIFQALPSAAHSVNDFVFGQGFEENERPMLVVLILDLPRSKYFSCEILAWTCRELN